MTKYLYSFELKYHKDGRPILLMKLPPPVEMVGLFLFTEVHIHSAGIFRAILDEAINGVADHNSIVGNIYGLEVGPEFTAITNEIDPDAEGRSIIETKELRELIDIWLNEKERRSTT